MRRSRSPHVSHVTRADDEGNGPPEFMCHMWMHERPPPYFLSTTSDFPLPISYVYVSFRSSFAHFPLPMARPGGMRGAIE